MTDPITIAVVLGPVADKVIEALAYVGTDKVLEAALEKLRGDKSKNAFKLALGEAINKYAYPATEFNSEKIKRWVSALPLLQRNGALCVTIGETEGPQQDPDTVSMH